MFEPPAPLSALVQSIWSASLLQTESIVKPLYADAGSGIIFNFFGDILIDNETLSEGVIMLPVKNKADKITLKSGAKIAGIRFHPAVGYGVLGQNYDKATLLAPEDDQLYNLYQIYSELQKIQDNECLNEYLYIWAKNNLGFINTLPDCMEHAFNFIEHHNTLEKIGYNTSKSQRQIERHFKSWLGMTPKHYQRILRIKKTIYFLRLHKNANLADVAHQFGFSDQAHMTREFKAIAHITPKQV